MTRIILEGDTLGKKHRNYNKLVNEALSTDQPVELSQDDDIRNLLTIDIASKKRNVDYILEVLKLEDQLLVSKAIKRSTWLVTEPQYAHIINPEHLYTKLYPQMTTKAFNKLMLNVRLHLRDEKRVEGFYNYIKEKDVKSAYKWLQHCSVPFVEIEVAEHNRNIPDFIIKRLFEKSFSVFVSYKYKEQSIVKDGEFLLKHHVKEFLDNLEDMKREFYCTFNAKNTKILMEKCPKRILDNFEFYGQNLHIETFVKHLSKIENIQDFLLKYANNKKFEWLYTFVKMKHFIMQLPLESRFDYVKKVFIEKEILVSQDDMEEPCIPDYDFDMYEEEGFTNFAGPKTYLWYQYAPFDIAFADVKNLIRAEFDPEKRNLILQVLLSCAHRNMQHYQILLQYYHDRHINEPFKFKIQFLNILISKIYIPNLDDQAWNTLIKLFHSMEVFIDSENNVQSCVKAIIVRNSVKKQQVPDIIEKKFVFDTLKTMQTKLKKQEEKDAVFEYLHNFITTKAKSLNLMAESEFNEAVTLCEHLLNLIKDWGKELQNYPSALATVKELVTMIEDKKWCRDLSSLYNTKKSWKKLMFEESVDLCPTEEVCINALKHDSGLFSRKRDKMTVICFNDTKPLKRLFSKIRIYWSHTLAEDWKTAYLRTLNQISVVDSHNEKSVVVGLCNLLPREEINKLLETYAPSETKISWDEAKLIELNTRRVQLLIAQNVYKARPLAAVERVLLYAKGDYLQYAISSVNAILNQLSPNKRRLYIPMLLDAPVSLQKFGVRYAFNTLTSEELKPMLTEIWDSTKNKSIRSIIFTYTFDLLCREKVTLHVNSTWSLLSTFIDKLTANESKRIYQNFGKIRYVPDSVKPECYMKSYTFLCTLPAKCNCETLITCLRSRADEVIEHLNENFVINVMLKNLCETIANEKYLADKPSIMTSFILASKDEETQTRRCENIIVPILEKYLPQWEMICEGTYRIKTHIKDILEKLVKHLKTYTIMKNMQIPVKTFNIILLILEKHMSYHKHYALLTNWKLAVTFVKLLNENKQALADTEGQSKRKITDQEKNEQIYNLINKMHEQIGPRFVELCKQHLEEDLHRFGASVHSLFGESLKTFLCTLTEVGAQYRLMYIKYFFQCGNNKREFYLMICPLFDYEAKEYEYCTPEQMKIFQDIHSIVMSQLECPDDVKMHFYESFTNIPIAQKP